MEGFGVARGFLDEGRQQELIDCLDAHREAVCWGSATDGSYHFNVFSNDPTAVETYGAVDPMPELLNSVAVQVFSALNKAPSTVWAHANIYHGLAGIERHQDPDSWQTDMVIINLQSPVVFHVYQVSQAVDSHCILEPGDVLHMSGACMKDNEHEVRTVAHERCHGEDIWRRINRTSIAFHDVLPITEGNLR